MFEQTEVLLKKPKSKSKHFDTITQIQCFCMSLFDQIQIRKSPKQDRDGKTFHHSHTS